MLEAGIRHADEMHMHPPKHPLRLAALVVVIGCGVMLIAAYTALTYVGLFVQIPHVDVPAHLFGGGLLAAGLILAQPWLVPGFATRATTVFLIVLVVSLGWETLEATLGALAHPPIPWTVAETAKDISLSMAGAVISILTWWSLSRVRRHGPRGSPPPAS